MDCNGRITEFYQIEPDNFAAKYELISVAFHRIDKKTSAAIILLAHCQLIRP